MKVDFSFSRQRFWHSAAPPLITNTISVTAVNGNLYQQTVQSPCVFSNPSCTNGSFAATPLPTGGGVSGYDSFSPVYTGSTIFGIIGAGNSIELGLDINQASGQPAQTLSAFYMLKNGSVVDTFTGSANNVPWRGITGMVMPTTYLRTSRRSCRLIQFSSILYSPTLTTEPKMCSCLARQEL